jgi:hypothetical protein
MGLLSRTTPIPALLCLLLLGQAPATYGQASPPLNPNADSPTDDLDLEDVSPTSDDLDALGDAADDLNQVTDDVDAAIQDQLNDIGGTLNDVTDDIFNGGGLEPVQDVFDVVNSAQEAFASLQQTFQSIFNINRLLDRLNIDLPDIFEDPLGGLNLPGGDDSDSNGGNNTVEISTGALGLPDPKQIEQEIAAAQPSAFEEVSATKTGGSGSPVIKRDLVTQFERELTDEVADQTALTQAGQQKLRDNAAAAKQSLATSQTLAADSEQQDVSQNILRNLSTQLAAQQQTSTLDTVSNQLRARDDALRNKMLVDAVRELQGDRIQDRVKPQRPTPTAIVQGGQIILPGVGIKPGDV